MIINLLDARKWHKKLSITQSIVKSSNYDFYSILIDMNALISNFRWKRDRK